MFYLSSNQSRPLPLFYPSTSDFQFRYASVTVGSGRAAMGFMAFLQPVSDSYPCGRIPQNAAPLLAKTSDGPPTL